MKKITITSRDTREGVPTTQKAIPKHVEGLIDSLYESPHTDEYIRTLLQVAFPLMDEPALDTMIETLPEGFNDLLRERITNIVNGYYSSEDGNSTIDGLYGDMVGMESDYIATVLYNLAPLILRAVRELLTEHVIIPHNQKAQINPDLQNQI